MLYFLTFGAGNQNYIDAANRLCDEARATGLFQDVLNITEAHLRADMPFWSRHGKFIEENPRGFGYWIWKPYIIKRILEGLSSGDILIYADAGCVFNKDYSHLILRLSENIRRKKILGVLGQSNDATHTKSSVSSYLGLVGIPTLRLGHIQAGLLYMYKCEEIDRFVSKWYDKCCLDSHMIDDSPSRIKNYEGFKEHRHDQSVLNVLLKLEGLYNQSLPVGIMPIVPAQNRSG